MLWCCVSGRDQRGNNAACSALSWLLVTSSALHKGIGHFWCWLLGGWVCVHSRTLWVSLTNCLVRLGVFLLPQPSQLFPIHDLRLYFPALEPWVAQSVLLPSCTSWFICPRMWVWHHLLHQPLLHWVLQPQPCCESSAQLPVSAPPTGLDECVLFNSLVVGLPYSSIFCQFWLFFVFKLLSFFWLCKEAQCVYLRLHVGWKTGILEEQLYNPNMESLMPFLLVFKTS